MVRPEWLNNILNGKPSYSSPIHSTELQDMQLKMDALATATLQAQMAVAPVAPPSTPQTAMVPAATPTPTDSKFQKDWGEGLVFFHKYMIL